MSNHKMQFPSHISKSWLSVCIFIFLLTVCVGLAIHVTSEEDAICSDSDHSEVPIVSNENVSEKSGSDIEYAKNYVPTEEDVLAARQQATEGMSQQQIENLTEVVKTANLWLEHKYMNGDFFEQLSDPNNLYWNYFHQTGEIQIGWAVDGGLDMDTVCERENLSIEEFYAKYGTPVVTTNLYDADGFIGLLSEINSFIQNENLKSELQYLMDQTEQAKETHRMEIVNDIYKKVLYLKHADYAVLVDVEMGRVSGFEVAAYLQKAYPQIPYIFLTGHAEWALKGYDYSPLDFLTKPLSSFRLEQSLERIAASHAAHGMEAEPSSRKIGIMVSQGYVFLAEEEILYIERINRKACIHQNNGVSITLNDTLKNLEQIFSKDKFFRCHQSFLVNLNYIEGIRVENGGNVFFLQLHGCQDCIPLSRKAYPELKKCLEAHGIWFH